MENTQQQLYVIRNKLIEFGKIPQKEIEGLDAKGKIKDPNEYSLEFVFGVILDQGIKYEKAWSAPFELEKRLGHLDVYKIANMDEKELESVIFSPPALHRYRYMADRLIEASERIVKEYDGNASNIWKEPVSAKELEGRFREFKQIGQKKASMAVNILVRDFNIKITGNRSGIDVSNDVQVRRVFRRTGITSSDKEEDIVNAARNLNPDYPGELDYPAWVIGKKWCRPKEPICTECPLDLVCLKILA